METILVLVVTKAKSRQMGEAQLSTERNGSYSQHSRGF